MFKKKIIEDNLGQSIRYGFSKQNKVYQRENVFVFDLETYNEKEYETPYAAGFYDVKRSHEV